MAVVIAFCGVEFINGIEGGMDDAGNDELGDTHATLYAERLVAMVDKVNMDFSAIVGIDGAGSVKDGKTVFTRKTAAWTHLCLVAGRQADTQTSGKQMMVAGIEQHGQVDGSTEVKTRTLQCLVLRQWE